jgi:DNA topoisomerase-1
VGEYEEKEMTASIGRFGPYIKHDSKFYSLPKELDPYKVNEEEAITVIEDKRKKDKEKVIKTFEEEPGLIVQHGRYGPYIAFEKNNYKIPKTVKPEELTLEDVRKIISETDPSKSTKTKTEKKPKAKATTKKSTTTKAKAKTTTTKAKAKSATAKKEIK